MNIVLLRAGFDITHWIKLNFSSFLTLYSHPTPDSQVMGEEVPDFTNKFSFFMTPGLRSYENHKAKLPYATLWRHLKDVFEKLGIDCAKVTHQVPDTHSAPARNHACSLSYIFASMQGRGQGQRELDQLGVPLDEIARIAGYNHDEQSQSYLTLQPPGGTCAAAGGDHQNTEGFMPAHVMPACESSVMQVVDEVLPWLRQQEG